MRYAERYLGFLAGLLLAGVAIGIAHRYRFDPLEERTLPFYIRSSLHAIGLTCSGWAVHLAFAAIPRSHLGTAVRRLPLAAEFAIKALVMAAVLTVVAVGLQVALYPFPLSKQWVADELPRILAILSQPRCWLARSSSSGGSLVDGFSAAFCSALTTARSATSASSCS